MGRPEIEEGNPKYCFQQTEGRGGRLMPTEFHVTVTGVTEKMKLSSENGEIGVFLDPARRTN